MFEPFTFVLALVLGIPIVKAIATRISRGGPGSISTDQVLRLKQALDAAEQRTLDSDKRVTDLEDRVDFLEKLLQAPRPAAPLPPGREPARDAAQDG